MTAPEALLPETLDAMSGGFERAMGEHPTAARCWRLSFAGRPVRMRVVGHALAANLADTFGHLVEPDARPAAAAALTIDLWDRVETGVACPELPVGSGGTWNVGGHMMRFTDDHLVVHYQEPRSTVCLHRAANRIVGCFADGGGLCLHERSKPFPELLSIWYHDRGVQQLHAGLVARDGRGLLLMGGSGTGKSTSTLASVIGGLDFLGDDFVGLELASDGSCLGHSLYAGARVAADHLQRLPALMPHAEPPRLPGDDKSLVFMSRAFPDRTARCVRIAAVVLPEVTGPGPTTFAKLPKAHALVRMLPTTLVSAPGSGRTGFENLAALVARVPSFAMQIGQGIAGISHCVEAILAQTLRPCTDP